MNVAIAFTLFKKRGVKVPDHLALLLEQVSPLAGPDVKGGGGRVREGRREPCGDTKSVGLEMSRVIFGARRSFE